MSEGNSKLRFRHTLLFFVVHFIFICTVTTETCMEQLKNVDEFRNASSSCLNQMQTRMGNVPVPRNSVQLVEMKYEDNCFSKCVMENMNFTGEGTTINQEVILQVIKDNAPADIQSHMKEIIIKCADSTTRLWKLAIAESTEEMDPCKFYAMFHHCFNEQEQRIC